jgi:hypothetical protein
MELRLRLPTQAEFDEWLPGQQAQYAAEIVASGALPLAAAEQKAIRDTTTRLPDGFRTPGQLIFRLMAGEEPAGWLWLEVPYSGGADPHMAWVNDVEVTGPAVAAATAARRCCSPSAKPATTA